MIKIQSVASLPSYQLCCVFENGEQRIYDMSYVQDLATPMLLPLREKTFFASVFLEAGAPSWPNGYELCPDAIWLATNPRSVAVRHGQAR